MSVYKTSPQPCLIQTENSQLSVFPHTRDASVPAGTNPSNAALDIIYLLCYKDTLLTHGGKWQIPYFLMENLIILKIHDHSFAFNYLKKIYNQLALIFLAF